MRGEFRRWSEAVAAEYFLLRLRHAHSRGPPHEKIMEAIRLLGKRSYRRAARGMPGWRPRGLVNQSHRIEMTGLPVTRHTGESGYDEWGRRGWE